MPASRRRGRGADLPEILAGILEANGAVISRRAGIWEAALPGPLGKELGRERIRLVVSPAGRAARGAEADAAITERILLLARSKGEVTRLVAESPLPKGAVPGDRQWVRLYWRIRYGSDDLPEELLVQSLPVGSSGGVKVPRDGALRAPTADEARSLPPPDPERVAQAWARALRQLERRIRERLRPHEDRARRELHREMRTLSVHFRSLIAEERSGRRRRTEDREAGRMLQLKEDWERKLAAAIRQRSLDTEARLIATALVTLLPEPRGGRTV
ncbi:MAG TPA: hypothetical protein VF363_12340 [Candidatus Eisenbacteria bacterium]